MSARYEITDTNGLRIDGIPWRERGLLVQYGAIRQQSADLDKLRAELAAVVAERDRIKGDHDEAAHFARHFIRDDPNITPRGAIIRLGDKCTDLFVRLQQAEARLSAIDSAPVVAWSWEFHGIHFDQFEPTFIAPDEREDLRVKELIAKPAKD